MQAILIARVSTEEQKEAGLSLPAQVARLEKYCKDKGVPILKIFSFDESAYKDQRSDFDAILDFVIQQKGKILVCCDKVDRLSRNIFDKRISVLYERALNDQIELHFVSDGQIINSRISAVEKFQFGISLGLAKYYSDAISDNVKRAIEQKLQRGELPGKAPYGYKNVMLDNDQADIIVDDYASKIVQKAFELYATGAYALNRICEKFKEEHGLDWGVSFIHKMFSNPFYYGQMIIKKKMYPHRYPPIISQSLFEQVQQMRNGFAKKRHKYGGHPYLYRGLLHCATCGLTITAERHKGHVYYHCTQYNGKHGAKWIREEKITETLGNFFKKLQMPVEVLEQIMQTLDEIHNYKTDFRDQEFDKLTREHKDVAKMMDNLYLDKLKGRITESDYDRFYQTFREQLVGINLKIEQLQEADDNYYITVKLVLKVINRAYGSFVGSEVEERRQFIKMMLSNLRVEGENIVWEVAKPFDLILECSEHSEWRPQGESNPYY